MTAGSGGGKPARGFPRIFFYAAPVLVERRESVLRFGTAGAGGGAEQLGGAREILREYLAFEIEQRKIIGCRWRAELGRRGEKLGRLGRIAFAAAPVVPHESQL